MTFDPSEQYGEEKLCLIVEEEYEGYPVEAYCSPDSKALDYDADGNDVTEFPEDNTSPVGVPTTNWSRKRFGAPFGVDVVFTDEVPDPEAVLEIRAQLGEDMESAFAAKTDELHQKISESDDPLETIMDLEAEDIAADNA